MIVEEQVEDVMDLIDKKVGYYSIRKQLGLSDSEFQVIIKYLKSMGRL